MNFIKFADLNFVLHEGSQNSEILNLCFFFKTVYCFCVFQSNLQFWNKSPIYAGANLGFSRGEGWFSKKKKNFVSTFLNLFLGQAN